MRIQVAKPLVPIILFAFLLFVTPRVYGQQDSDLEITVETPSGPVRGGESFSYTAKVRNSGTAKAVDVVLLNEPAAGTSIKTSQPSTGSCEPPKRSGDREVRCSLGDLLPNAEVTIAFSVEIIDFDVSAIGMLGELPTLDTRPANIPGDPAKAKPIMEEPPTDYKGPVNKKASIDSAKAKPTIEEPPTDIATLYVAGTDLESNDENNALSVKMIVRPSANRAPELEIVSPRDSEVLTRPANRRTNFTITARAVDPDGTIDRVVVKDPSSFPLPTVEDGVYKFLYLGKTYTAEELETYLSANPAEERVARRTAKDTFAYTLTDPDYGYSPIVVVAYDNLGRSTFRSVVVSVEGDATVEIVNPKSNDVVEPGSTITIEIVSKLNGGKLKEIELSGVPHFARLSPQLVSKQGNVYRHRYLWKTASSGYANLRATIVEDSGAIRNSQEVKFIIKKSPVISITSMKDGDVFSFLGTVRIAFNVTNAEPGQEYTVMVDGKNVASTSSNEFTWRDLRLGSHVVQIAARDHKVELSRSEPVTIRVK